MALPNEKALVLVEEEARTASVAIEQRTCAQLLECWLVDWYIQ